MSTLDEDDFNAIRAIVKEELLNDVNANTYVKRVDANVSSTSGLSETEHNQLMNLKNTSVAEATIVSRAAVAIAATRRKK